MSSTVSTRILDHIVYLTPPGTLEEECTEFKDLGFRVLPGGTHADGLTANALIVLSDHVYLELIHFTQPADGYPIGSPLRLKRDTHPWSESFKKPGFVAFAFLGSGSVEPAKHISAIINARAQEKGLSPLYSDEQAGGRIRPDGQELKWLTSFPPKGTVGIEQDVLPFFCGDVTPRGLRVPVIPPSNAEHDSGSTGVAFVRLLVDLKVDSKDLSTISTEIDAIVGRAPASTTPTELTWDLDTPNDGRSKLVVGLPQSEEENEFVQKHGSGIFEIGFWSKRTDQERVLTKYGRFVKTPQN